MKRFGLQGFKWKRVEPSWVELGKLKQQTGTSQVKMRFLGLLERLKKHFSGIVFFIFTISQFQRHCCPLLSVL